MKEPLTAFFPTTEHVDLVKSLEKISQLDNVTKIYGSHHRLGLEPTILQEVKSAVQFLHANDLIAHGTGVHRFSAFSLHF